MPLRSPLSAFTLVGDTTAVEIANVTIDPSHLQLSYDAAASITQSLAVVKSTSVIDLTAEAGAVGSEEPFTVTAIVSSATPEGSTPTGYVEFRLGSTVIAAESSCLPMSPAQAVTARDARSSTAAVDAQ